MLRSSSTDDLSVTCRHAVRCRRSKGIVDEEAPALAVADGVKAFDKRMSSAASTWKFVLSPGRPMQTAARGRHRIGENGGSAMGTAGRAALLKSSRHPLRPVRCSGRSSLRAVGLYPNVSRQALQGIAVTPSHIAEVRVESRSVPLRCPLRRCRRLRTIRSVPYRPFRHYRSLRVRRPWILCVRASANRNLPGFFSQTRDWFCSHLPPLFVHERSRHTDKEAVVPKGPPKCVMGACDASISLRPTAQLGRAGWFVALASRWGYLCNACPSRVDCIISALDE